MMISVENMVLSPGPHSEMENPVGSSRHREVDIFITRWNPVRTFTARRIANPDIYDATRYVVL